MTAATETLEWEGREAKFQSDRSVCEIISPWLSRQDRPRVLSLPASGWRWELFMDDMFPETKFSFLGLERNPAVFERMQRNGAVLNLDRLSVFSSYYGDFEHFVDTHMNPIPYQFIYLDCMGTWGEDKLQWIQLMFQNRLLAKQSWFRFTIGANRGHPHKWIPLVNSSHIPEPYHVQNLRSHGKPIHPWLINGIPRLIAEVGHTYGYEVVPRLCTIYHSKETPTSKGKPQLVYLFKVKQHKTS